MKRQISYPATPLVFLALVVALLALLAARNPVQALFGVVVAMGVPVYAWLFRHRIKQPERDLTAC